MLLSNLWALTLKYFNFLLRRNWRKAGWWSFCCTWIMSHSISDIQACAKVQMECLGGSKGRWDPPVPWLDGECWLTRSFELQRKLQALRCNFSQHYRQCSRAEDRRRILGLNLSWKTKWMLPEADFYQYFPPSFLHHAEHMLGTFLCKSWPYVEQVL